MKVDRKGIRYHLSFQNQDLVSLPEINRTEHGKYIDRIDLSGNKIEYLEYNEIINDSLVLNISKNRISQISDDYSFPNLIILEASNNKFDCIPEPIRYAKSLEFLDISNNQLKFLNCDDFSIPNLRRIDIGGNPTKTIPGSLIDCPNLQTMTYYPDLFKQLVLDIEMLFTLFQWPTFFRYHLKALSNTSLKRLFAHFKLFGVEINISPRIERIYPPKKYSPDLEFEYVIEQIKSNYRNAAFYKIFNYVAHGMYWTTQNSFTIRKVLNEVSDDIEEIDPIDNIEIRLILIEDYIEKYFQRTDDREYEINENGYLAIYSNEMEIIFRNYCKKFEEDFCYKKFYPSPSS